MSPRKREHPRGRNGCVHRSRGRESIAVPLGLLAGTRGVLGWFSSMEDASDFVTENTARAESSTPTDPEQPVELGEPADPITSRFLYVDVAAMRAKQLRRGARLRYELEPGSPAPKKPERMAMEEVRRCLVQYTIPVWRGVGNMPVDQA